MILKASHGILFSAFNSAILIQKDAADEMGIDPTSTIDKLMASALMIFPDLVQNGGDDTIQEFILSDAIAEKLQQVFTGAAAMGEFMQRPKDDIPIYVAMVREMAAHISESRERDNKEKFRFRPLDGEFGEAEMN